MKSTGRPSIYKWDFWLAQACITLVRGVDYHVSQSSMTQQIRNAAHVRDIGINMEDRGDRITICRKDALWESIPERQGELPLSETVS